MGGTEGRGKVGEREGKEGRGKGREREGKEKEGGKDPHCFLDKSNPGAYMFKYCPIKV